MNQKYTTILIVVLFAAAAFIGGYLWGGSDDSSPQPTPTVSEMQSFVTETPRTTAAAVPAVVHSVTISQTGPSPKSLTINVGDAVVFRNAASFAVWPASDPHPSHTQCPWLDAGRGLKNGETYTLVFTSAATCTYHSHLDPSNDALRGTIVAR